MNTATEWNLFTDQAVKDAIEFCGLPEEGAELGDARYVWMDIPAGARIDDYLNVNMRDKPLRVPKLILPDGLWMSLTPMEIQSAWVAIQRSYQYEKIAIGGLGMGYVPLAIADSDVHQEIDVYELNPDVIALFKSLFSEREGFDKFRFIEGDARQLLTGQEYDYVFMDIYQTLGSEKAIHDIELFMTNNRIGEYRYWGQEAMLIYAIDSEWFEDTEVYDLRRKNIWTFEDGMMLRMHQESDDSRMRMPHYCMETALEAVEMHLIHQEERSC